jgi:hypothetical protein
MLDVLLSLDRSLLLKGAIMVALMAAGGAAIWSALWPEAGFQVTAPAGARPLPPLAPRLEPGSEMRMLTVVIERSRTQLQSIQTTTLLANRQIDVAELALLRLLQEVASVMPTIGDSMATLNRGRVVVWNTAPAMARAA